MGESSHGSLAGYDLRHADSARLKSYPATGCKCQCKFCRLQRSQATDTGSGSHLVKITQGDHPEASPSLTRMPPRTELSTLDIPYLRKIWRSRLPPSSVIFPYGPSRLVIGVLRNNTFHPNYHPHYDFSRTHTLHMIFPTTNGRMNSYIHKMRIIRISS